MIWLDYDRPLDSAKLSDISTVVTKVRSGSVVVVTVDAKPERLQGADGRMVVLRRLAGLRKRIPENKIPLGTKGSHLAGWGLARTYREVIHNQIEETLAHRNAPRPERWRLRYHQLFNFHYADGAKMLTVGGYFVNKNDEAKLPISAFSDLSFTRVDEDPYHIEVPVLTWREASFLDSRLPRLAPEVRIPRWLGDADRKKYGQIYRYFPTYLEAEL